MNIRAPFNFVPVSDFVFSPEWADRITHDIPFEDSEDGVIELKLKSETEIYVRNGHKRDIDKNDDEYLKFSHINGSPFIPSTSIKGSIRNVLEIISFGKMGLVSDDRYSIRDLQLKKYLGFFQNSDVHCGWMKRIDEDRVEIEDCGIPRRISHKDLDKAWGTNFYTLFADEDLLKNDENRTALFKIRKCENKLKTWQFKELPLNNQNVVDKRIKVVFDNSGPLQGTIVVTGQPSARKERILNNDGTIRKKASGKAYEFVFPDNPIGYFSLDTMEPAGIYKDFEFIYKESVDWAYWKKVLRQEGRVPVFFSLKNGRLLHFGLSYLYKLPFKKRVKGYLDPNHLTDKPDLASCIFGYTNPMNSLKGRVQFSHCFLDEGHETGEVTKLYLGSPKPTYYPIYIEQKGKDGYPEDDFKTFLDEDAKIKGWKRYPVHNELKDYTPLAAIKPENLSCFIALKPDSVFSLKIRFHNLKKCEIGALLQALTPSTTFSHSIGLAKPFGFGLISVSNVVIRGCKFDKDVYTASFKQLMEEAFTGYSKSPQINELRLMGIPQTTKVPLVYMPLKEFVEKKKQKRDDNGRGSLINPGEYLEYYSGLIMRQKDTPPNDDNLLEAEVVIFKRPVFSAKLTSGDDNRNLNLENLPDNIRLKKGDIILVKRILKGGSLKGLTFVKVK